MEQLFPTEPLCGNCGLMRPLAGDCLHGYCPALDMSVTVRTGACQTKYQPKMKVQRDGE